MQNHTIVDRVVERIKKQPIGDLIQEEDLFEIVKQAIPKAFFETRVSGEGYHRKEAEPLLVEIVRECMRPAVQAAVDKFFIENAQTLLDSWQPVFENGITEYVRKVNDETIKHHIAASLKSMIDRLNQERGPMGLPYLTVML